jgi:hypothetical protein
VERLGHAETDAAAGARNKNDLSLKRFRHDQLLFD